MGNAERERDIDKEKVIIMFHLYGTILVMKVIKINQWLKGRLFLRRRPPSLYIKFIAHFFYFFCFLLQLLCHMGEIEQPWVSQVFFFFFFFCSIINIALKYCSPLITLKIIS